MGDVAAPLSTGEMAGTPIRWVAVHTMAGREGPVAYWLDRGRYRIWYPYIKISVRRGRGRGRYGEVMRSYFPRYLFAGIRETDSYGGAISAINDTSGVSTVVHLNGNPLEIPGPVIAELMGRTEGGELMLACGLPKEPAAFDGKVGDGIKIVGDPAFTGLMGEVFSLSRLDAHGEIGIWLNLLGADRKMFLPASKIGKITE